MDSSEKDETKKISDTLRAKITTTISIGDSDSSLSLSLTPPSLSDGGKTEKNEPIISEHSEDSISEHLSSVATSIENDRSLHEIEIDNIPAFSLDDYDNSEQENQRISQEAKPISLNSSVHSNSNSIISLAALDTFGLLNIEHGEIKSILEEILNNDQFVSDSEILSKRSEEDRFDIFADLDLDDKSLTERIMNQVTKENTDVLYNRTDSNIDNVLKQVKDLEELLEDKNQTIVALSTELDSLREVVSNPSTLSMGSPTEYKQLHEDYHNKFVEYHNAIEQKDDLILQLTESLQQSIANREELKVQVEHFKNELEYLQKQLENTSQMLLKNEPRNKTPELEVIKKIAKESSSLLMDQEDTNFETECLKLQKILNSDQVEILNTLKSTINKYIDDKLDESKNENENVLLELTKTIEEERGAHDKEVERLRELLANMKCGSAEIMELRKEMEVIHQKETEDLRMYFEKKCADLEKNFSEEVFSQHSRKRSGSTTSSDNELPPDIAVLQSKPGPGGDAPCSLETYRIDYKKRALQNLSKTDLRNLKQDLNNILNIFNKFEVDNSSEDDLRNLKEDLGNYDVQNLFKIEMEAFRSEMKNKYNAELEILNQDYENKVDLLKVQQEEKLNSLKEKYLEEIDNLKDILNKTNKAIGYSSAVQEVSSGDFEINEVIQSYERRLQEQVTLAKIDIIAALESQIQRLAADEGQDEEWPQELLVLRDRFTERFEKKLAVMEEEHHSEIARLKEEHIKNLNGALERARRRSLKDGDNLTNLDGKVVEERDNFKKQASLLRKLLGELLKYFTQCEDEVNNTIVDELVRQATEKNLTDIEKELNDSTSSSKTGSSSSATTPSVKRVHLTPNFSDLMNILDNSSGRDTESMEFSTDLKNELESCLEKLRTEANAVLALSLNVSKKSEGEVEKREEEERALSSLNRKLIEEVQLRVKMSEELEEQSSIIESLERERTVLEAQVLELIERLNVTQSELEKAQIKISGLLESGQQEEVSEGYGGTIFGGEHDKGHAVEVFNQLQEKARTLLVGSHSHDPRLLRLLEELVNSGEIIIEETKAERRDLQQQIDVADKKYKQTCKFLEEQAAERELERDDSQKQISLLQDELKSVDKDRATFANINEEQGIDGMATSTSRKTVEHLEARLRESSEILEDKDRKLREVETEKDEAVDKIYFLRDVIRDLESQVKVKIDTEVELRNLVSELELLISQSRGIGAGSEKSERHTDNEEAEILREHVRVLEAEVQKLRVSQELVGTEGALREVRNQLIEIENTIDKKTKELEEQSSIVSTTTCSSPSEDMSVRDVVRPKTPTSLAGNECEIPLQQLARLKEKLIRHARAEDAALKRIRDLEMQVFTLKAALEEQNTEKDILKKEISDQLVLISSLQIRLDDQRIRAEHIEKQTNSSLESKIYDLQKEITDLQEHLENRNKTIAHLNVLVEEMRKKIKDKETEDTTGSEDEMIITMQKEIEHLRNQNELLHKRLTSGVDIIPNLVENIISDKNSDIESLKQKLGSVEKQLEMYNSLNLDNSQISALRNLRTSGTSLSEVLSIIELSTPDQPRRMTDSRHDENFGQQSFIKRKPMRGDDTVFLYTDDVKEISSIEKIGSENNHFTSMPFGKRNSTEISKSGERHVHFNLSSIEHNSVEIERLVVELDRVKFELTQKDQIINDCNERLKQLNHLETNIDFVQTKLEETQNTLKDMTDKFEKEISNREDTEKELKIELVQKKVYLEEQQKELQLLKEDAERKDNMYFNLARETKDLKKERENLEDKLKEYQDTEEIVSVKNKIILELEKELDEFRSKNYEDAIKLENRIKENEGECESLKLRLDSYSKENKQKDRLIEKLEVDNKQLTEIVKVETENGEKLRNSLQNKEREIEEYEGQMNRLKRQLEFLENEKGNWEKDIEVLKKVISEKNKVLDELNEETKRSSQETTKLEDEMRILRNNTVTELEKKVIQLQEENSSKRRELESVTDRLKNLNEELGHLQDLVVEKDKIIARFREDSEQLQMNLESIQNKMQETGNIIDLGRKLRDEQMRNGDLFDEVQMLKAQMAAYKFLDKDAMVTSIDEITGKMQKELDYSAQIDSNIINATEEVDNNDELEDTLFKLKLKYKDLNKKYSEAQQNNKLLMNELEKNRFEFDAVQLEDAKLMEQLRIHLDAATENESELEQVIESWKRKCENLEIELSRLRSQLSNANSKTESTEYKNLPTKESQEVLRLKNEVSQLNVEVAQCKDEIKSLRKGKRELESNLRYNKDMAELKNKEIENLEKNLSEKCKRETELSNKYAQCNEQLQIKIKEVENSRILIDDMDQERRDMKAELNRLNVKLRSMEKEKKKPSVIPNSSFPIADQLMNKIEEINSTVKNDRRTMDLILRLTNDNKLLKNKIMEMEAESASNVHFENPMHRANYLFTKCLRIESYRKALIWQKQYLISLVGSYQVTTDLGPMEKLQGQKRIRFSGIRKFRSLVYSIIAVLRMKFIVRRWHSGARLAENINLRYKQFQRIGTPEPATRLGSFQVGQPVSSQQFAQSSGIRSVYLGGQNASVELGKVLGSSDSRLNVESGISERERDTPWSGASPPCKEKSIGKPRISSNIATLKAPQLLNQYAERYNRIQENLEMLLNPNPPT